MKKAVLLILAAVIALLAAALISVDDGELTAPPPHHGEEAALQPTVSTVTIPLRVSLSDIQRIIDEKLPHDLYQFDRVVKRVKCFGPERDEAGEARRTNCVDLAVKGRIERNGPVETVPAGEELELRVPVQGRARARGASGLLKMIKKTARGAFTVSFYLKPGVGEDGQIDLEVRSDFDWDVPLHTKVLGQKVDLSNAVDKILRRGLLKLERKVRETAADHSRWGNKVRDAYRRLQQPLKLHDDPEVWMLVEPQSLLVADLFFDEQEMALPLALRFDLRTYVGARPEFSVREDFPQLVRSDEVDTDFALALPLVLSYDALRAELGREVIDARIPVTDWLPGAAIVIRRLQLYPSGSRLVVGVEFETRGLADWLSAEGSVFLIGTPEFDNETKRLSVPNLEFTRRTGNSLFDFASYVFAGRLRELMRKSATFDLNDSHADMIARANAALNRGYGKELSVRGELQQLSLSDIQVRRENIIVLIQAQGRMEVFSVGTNGS